MANNVANLQVLVGADIKGALSGLQRVNSAITGAGAMFQTAAGTAIGFTAAALGLNAVGNVAGAVNGAIFGMNSTLQGAEIAFESMLGSTDAAQNHLAALASFAKSTPFDLPQLITASQRMHAFGFATSGVLPLLTDVGNTAAALNLGAAGVDRISTALGQMKAKGRVQGDELLQLQEAGINTGAIFEILARQTGKTIPELRKLQEAGKLDPDEFIAAFQVFAKQKFGGMMAEQSKTFVGAMSNIRDALSVAGASAFSPLFLAVQRGALAFAAFLDTDQFAGWVDIVRGGVHTAVTWLQTNLPGAIATAQAKWDELQPTFTTLKDWIAGPLLTTFGDLKGWMETNLPVAIQSLAGAWNDHLKPALDTVFAVLSPVAGEFRNLVGAVGTEAFANAGTVLGVIAAASGTIAVAKLAAAAVSFGAMAVAAGPLWLLAGAVGVLAVGIAKNGPAIGDFFDTFGQHFPDRVRELLRWVQVAGESLALLGTPGKLGALVGSGQLAPMVNNWMEGRTQAELKDWRSGTVFGADTGIPPLPPHTASTAPGAGAIVTQYNSFGDITIHRTADYQEVLEQLAGLEAQALATAGTEGLPGA